MLDGYLNVLSAQNFRSVLISTFDLLPCHESDVKAMTALLTSYEECLRSFS